ncbi:MAG: hypothetical protein ACLTER_26685 [Ruminococcus sp.]
MKIAAMAEAFGVEVRLHRIIRLVQWVQLPAFSIAASAPNFGQF